MIRAAIILAGFVVFFWLPPKPEKTAIPICVEVTYQRTDFAWDPKIYRCHRV